MNNRTPVGLMVGVRCNFLMYEIPLPIVLSLLIKNSNIEIVGCNCQAISHESKKYTQQDVNIHISIYTNIYSSRCHLVNKALKSLKLKTLSFTRRWLNNFKSR